MTPEKRSKSCIKSTNVLVTTSLKKHSKTLVDNFQYEEKIKLNEGQVFSDNNCGTHSANNLQTFSEINSVTSANSLPQETKTSFTKGNFSRIKIGLSRIKSSHFKSKHKESKITPTSSRKGSSDLHSRGGYLLEGENREDDINYNDHRNSYLLNYDSENEISFDKWLKEQKELQSLEKKLLIGLPRKDKRIGYNVYRKCFTGTELLTWIIQNYFDSNANYKQKVLYKLFFEIIKYYIKIYSTFFWFLVNKITSI
jgi:hypothetical protein